MKLVEVFILLFCIYPSMIAFLALIVTWVEANRDTGRSG
jgi:hypothetical protein